MAKQISWFYRIWKEGKYIDLWNIPHFLISLLAGFIFIYLHLTFLSSIVLIILLKTTWEIYEHIYVTKEAIPNKIFDVLTGVLVIVSVYYLPPNLITLRTFSYILFLNIILSIWGLYSMKRMNLFIKN